MEYLLACRFLMPLAEFLLCIFFLCICVTLKRKLALQHPGRIRGVGMGHSYHTPSRVLSP